MNVFFDLDDTIHDKSSSLVKCGNALFHNFLATSDIDHTRFISSFLRENCIIQSKVQVFQNLANEFSIPTATKQMMQSTFDSTFHQYAQRFDFVIETFYFLKGSGINIGCITNGRDFFQRNKIAALGLEEYFDVVVTSGELGIKKPDHRIFYSGLAALDASPCNSVFVGDNLKADMIPAKELGMAIIWKSERCTDVPQYVDYRLSTFVDFQQLWERILLTIG